MFCDLEVGVSGQETFFVNTKLLASFSGTLQKLFSKLEAGKKGSLKLIFDAFPGGAEGFELIVRFCYSGGRINISPSNVFLVYSAAKFLEINENQTKRYFETVHFWTWSDLLVCLKQCQKLLSFTNYSYAVQEILNAVVGKISTPHAFSCSYSSSIQFSGDASSNSSRSSGFQASIWLRDLEFLSIGLFEKVVGTMVSRKLDQGMICSFLLHYQRVKFSSLVSADHKCKIIEVVIRSLRSLDGNFNFPFRSLCGILQASFSLNMEKCYPNSLERLVGSRLDEATLDDLLVPRRNKGTCAYDVNLVLRLLKIYLRQSRKTLFAQRLKKVGFLMDMYLAEVAPDPHLKPCKFLALASGLPETARESHDRIYEFMDLYFKVHKFISEEERGKICSALNYDKLSSESLANLAKNVKFPACASTAALVFLQAKLKAEGLESRRNSSLSAKEDDRLPVQNSKGKQCRKVENRSAEVATSVNVTCPTNGKSLPRLCS